MPKSAPQLLVWLVDDDENDYLLIHRIIERVEAPVALRYFRAAIAAMKELLLPHCVPPDLIICDLKMPALSGDTFVRWLRSTKHRLVPVVMRSTSELEQDIRAAYESGANAFVPKGMDLEAMDDNVRNIVRFGLMLKQVRGRNATTSLTK
jgi:CheY-like chemotaxis protein